MIFGIANFLFLLIAGVNLVGVITGQAPSVRETALRMAGEPGGLERLRTALAFAWLAQLYLVCLVFPLKALHFGAGLAWAVVMLVSICETLYTSRTMLAAGASQDPEAHFTIHDSTWYRAYQVVFSLATIATCIALLLPRD